ncbi:MAG: hypothetical protein KDA99_22550, partial [Planctomycetales bacterium]|nr:hypothetical protein [Planctomycetales bacterium]
LEGLCIDSTTTCHAGVRRQRVVRCGVAAISPSELIGYLSRIYCRKALAQQVFSQEAEICWCFLVAGSSFLWREGAGRG